METSSAVPSNVPRVDTHLAKFSQAGTVLLSALAFLLNQPIIVVITAIILLLAAIEPSISPFRLLYRYIVLPLHLLRPRIVEDDPAPHRAIVFQGVERKPMDRVAQEERDRLVEVEGGFRSIERPSGDPRIHQMVDLLAIEQSPHEVVTCLLKARMRRKQRGAERP